MRKTALCLIGSLTVGLVALGSGSASAASGVINVPESFVSALSDTRAAGHYELAGTGLHIWTTASPEGVSPNQSKVAEYVAADTPLAAVGEPSLNYTALAGIAPGYQLVVDFDNDGTPDGILVGETVYGNNWWLSNGSAQFVKDGAPFHSGGFGSANNGTLDQWRVKFPAADVKAFGFSLGSGVIGEGTLNSITFADTTYTFGMIVRLDGRNACKNGGWRTSNAPVFSNQGDCVSYFASAK